MNKKEKIIYIYFLLLPFLDLITSLMTRFTNLSMSLGMIVKGLTFVFSTIYVFFFSKSKYKKHSIIYILLVLLFAILYFVTKIDILKINNIFTELVNAFKYLYFPIMFVCLMSIFDDFKISNELIKKILLYNLITYAFLMLFPYITNTSFNSYRYNNVDGENGWFYAANETGAIITILLSSLYVFMDNKNKLKIFVVVPLMLPLALMGTKVSYLGLILVVLLVIILYILNNWSAKNKKEIFVLPFILILLTILVCNISPTIKNLEGSIDRNSELVTDEKIEEDDKTFKYEDISDLIKNEKINKIVKIALNGRDKFFLMNYSIYEESSLVDKLFGLSWSDRKKFDYTFERKLIEIDYLDIVIHYGIIGFIIYFLPLCYFIINVFKRISKKDYETWFYLLILFIGLAISALAGHVLAAPAVSIYLILIMLIISNNLKYKE